MKNNKMGQLKQRFIGYSLSIGALLFCLSMTLNNNEITREEAVKIAEAFVVNNGYTTLPADRTKLSYELFDHRENNLDTILSRRRNLLHPKAFCFLRGEDDWNIGFLLTFIEIDKLDSIQKQSDLAGVAVIVSSDGKEARLAHKTPLFSYFTKLW